MARQSQIVPSRTIEKTYIGELCARNDCGEHVYLAAVDEVGRGSLAGPVTVGIAIVTNETSDSFPAGLRDSKQLTAAAREALFEPCSQWVAAWAVGSAQPSEINDYGIIAALRIAAARAVEKISAQGIKISAVLLDGSHNWWSPVGLFEVAANGKALCENVPQPPDIEVRTVVKGDAQCAAIAAASVFAKVQRDAYMVALADKYPHYHWDTNKGYSSAAHIAALKEYGVSSMHRTAWRLPGV